MTWEFGEYNCNCGASGCGGLVVDGAQLSSTTFPPTTLACVLWGRRDGLDR